MTKKYILKPGRHQFAPGSHAVHDNDSLCDEELLWYLERYPHIAPLISPRSLKGGALNNQHEKTALEERQFNTQQKQMDDLTPPSGGGGDI